MLLWASITFPHQECHNYDMNMSFTMPFTSNIHIGDYSSKGHQRVSKNNSRHLFEHSHWSHILFFAPRDILTMMILQDTGVSLLRIHQSIPKLPFYQYDDKLSHPQHTSLYCVDLANTYSIHSYENLCSWLHKYFLIFLLFMYN